MRKSRDAVHAGLKEVFGDWQKEKRSFEEWFGRERSSYVEYLWAGFIADTKKRQEAMLGLRPMDLDTMLPSEHTICVVSVMEILKNGGVPEQDIMQATLDFFRSGAISEAPFNVIAASMWASLAVKAGAGQKEPPNQGTNTDVNVVSTLLPYCDAMFIDNKARALITDIPQRHKLPYQCQIFSPNNGDDFVTYLENIRANAPKELIADLINVYGDGVLHPHTKIYGVGNGEK